jgi:hypothetical protein
MVGKLTCVLLLLVVSLLIAGYSLTEPQFVESKRWIALGGYLLSLNYAYGRALSKVVSFGPVSVDTSEESVTRLCTDVCSVFVWISATCVLLEFLPL